MTMPPLPLPPPDEAGPMDPMIGGQFVETPIDGPVVLPAPPADVREPIPLPTEPYPKPILQLPPATMERIAQYLADHIQALLGKHEQLERVYAQIETAYRALPIEDDGFPFKGRAVETIPIIASSIDPIHARLNVGVNKQDPVIRVKPITPRMIPFAEALQTWVNFRRKNVLDMPRHTGPAYLELCKLGTCIFKTVFDVEEVWVTGYTQPGWKVERKKVKRWDGARVFAVPAADVFWPAGYQLAEELPLIVERQRFTPDELMIASDGDAPKLDRAAVLRILPDATIGARAPVEAARDEASFDGPTIHEEVITVYEVWFDYDLGYDPADPDSKRSAPEKLVATIDLDSHELLQLRYNWYFHQRHPYTITPYSLVNGSLRGQGIGEMALAAQEAITRWYRIASDNAYLANIRMWASPKGVLREQRLQTFAGRVIPLNDPVKDLREIRLADVYPSTMNERSYLDQMTQRRTGSNDYMGGNESPVVGSRATATSTLALIQEGSRRVEEVMENVRRGETDVALKCLSLDLQYGPGAVFERVFGGTPVGQRLREFFASTSVEELYQGISLELAAADSGGSQAARQQTYLAIAQQVQAFTDRMITLGQSAFQAANAGDMDAAGLFVDALNTHRRALLEVFKSNGIPDAEDFLPDIANDVAEAAQRALSRPPAPDAGGTPDAGGPAAAGVGGQPGGAPAVAPPPDGMDAGLAPDTGVPGVDRTLEQFARATGGA